MMYDELINKLRIGAECFPGYTLYGYPFEAKEPYSLMPEHLTQAADAIEELEKEREKLLDDLGKAIRKLTEKHGEWEETKIYDGFGYFTIYKDSECGYEVARKTNYCPWCGAKMKMEENDE